MWLQPDKIKSNGSNCNISKPFSFLINQKFFKKRYQNNHHILSLKSTSKLCRFSIHQNCIEKTQQNDMELPPVKITSINVHRNGINFLPIEITSNKVRRNDVEFSRIEMTLDKFVETTWKFIDIFFSTFRCSIDIESTSIWRVVSVGNSIHSSIHSSFSSY